MLLMVTFVFWSQSGKGKKYMSGYKNSLTQICLAKSIHNSFKGEFWWNFKNLSNHMQSLTFLFRIIFFSSLFSKQLLWDSVVKRSKLLTNRAQFFLSRFESLVWQILLWKSLSVCCWRLAVFFRVLWFPLSLINWPVFSIILGCKKTITLTFLSFHCKASNHCHACTAKLFITCFVLGLGVELELVILLAWVQWESPL